jgi:N-acetylglucosaminyl-diphospho-decaprenol L-rhamnosyltransferase
MLAVIIVNYKNEDRTISYVKNELEKIASNCIIIIVNNEASHDSNCLLVEELQAELIIDITNKPTDCNKIFIIANNENLGFAKGNNLGVLFSNLHFQINYFLFSNNDIHFINNDVVEQLIKKIDSLPSIGMIGPKVIGLDGKNQSPEPYYPFWKKYILMYWVTPFISKSLKSKIFNLDYSQKAKEGIHYKVMGSFFLVRKDDFMSCGMMDPNTFLFAEEVILSERLKSINKKVYYYPEVAVIHEHSTTISKHLNEYKKARTQFTNECYYYTNYKSISFISIFIGRISVYLYLNIKSKLM